MNYPLLSWSRRIVPLDSGWQVAALDDLWAKITKKYSIDSDWGYLTGESFGGCNIGKVVKKFAVVSFCFSAKGHVLEEFLRQTGGCLAHEFPGEKGFVLGIAFGEFGRSSWIFATRGNVDAGIRN